MSKFIVFERTDKIDFAKFGQYAEIDGYVELRTERTKSPCRILRLLPDAEVEALEARLANYAMTLRDIRALIDRGEVGRAKLWIDDSLSGLAQPNSKTILELSDDRNAATARAEKAEAERDELRAKIDEYDSQQTGIRIALDAICPDMDGQRVIDPIERITRLGAEVARLRRMFKSSGTPESLVDGHTKDLEDEIRRLRVSLEVAVTGYRDALAENERLKAQLDGRFDADDRARFERETAARLLAADYADDRALPDGMTCAKYWTQREDFIIERVRSLADRFFAPAASKGDALCDRVTINVPPTPTVTAFEGRPMRSEAAPVPAFKVGDRVGPWTEEELRSFGIIDNAPSYAGKVGKIVMMWGSRAADVDFGDGETWYIGRGLLRPAPPAEPWTPKKGDEVKIIGSAFTPTDASRAMIGTRGKVLEMYTDFRGKIARVGECWFHASDLELVRRAEDAAS